MSFVQIVSAFRLYSADVLLLALGVTLMTSFLKKKVLADRDRKLFVFLPFALGFALFTAYRMIAERSLAPLGEEFFETLEGGFGCGCAATLYYCVWEQFFRGKAQKTDPLEMLLDFIPEERRKKAAEELRAGMEGKTEEEAEAYLKGRIAALSDPPMSEAECAAAAALLAKYFSALSGK